MAKNEVGEDLGPSWTHGRFSELIEVCLDDPRVTVLDDARRAQTALTKFEALVAAAENLVESGVAGESDEAKALADALTALG